jgi:hypothetical protein
VNRNHLLACAGDAGDCASYCASSAGSFRLCNLAVDPGWVNPDLCLLPAFNDLVDAGIDLGYDLVDGLPETFVGAGPDVGAREYGASRTYAGYTSSCP